MPATLDIVVIGGGTAGAAAAAALAQTGREVVLLESGPLERAGARWVNGLPKGEIERWGLTPPAPEHVAPFHLVAGWGPERITVEEPAIVDHDMRWLVRALQEQARAAGADLREGRRVERIEPGADAVRVHVRGEPTLRATFVVDAGGMTGPGARVPCPPERICVAAQQVREISDLDAARAWLETQRAKPGETLSFGGVAGGYSIVNVHIQVTPHPTVSLLTGSIPALGHPSGVALIERFVQEHRWIGEERFGGARPIPLTAPEPIVGQGRIARIGDAARQVFATHGSGIAQGLRAARLLARTLADGGGSWEYNVRFQREAGATLASSAAVAAWTASLTTAQVRELVISGLLHPALVAEGLAQEAPSLHPSLLPDLLSSAATQPKIAASMVPALIAAARLQRMHHRYPSTPERVPAWHAARHRVLRSVGAA
ncbi:MAG: FAD-dependent oxidoreductase [Deltaproteobacteria bacterium]|nr:MAG: FAD-dependent oxidoreductase [Deltaproteobacteria bacterium]